ncbi:hypothetical protein CSHOW_0329 [Campylobacter showae]|nr:hypothetical protein CSHOW_0329 [Campylobacter showae]
MKFHNILGSRQVKNFQRSFSQREYKYKNYNFIDKKQAYLSLPNFREEVSRDIEIFFFGFGGCKDS